MSYGPASASLKRPSSKTRTLKNTQPRARVVQRLETLVRNDDKLLSTTQFLHFPANAPVHNIVVEVPNYKQSSSVYHKVQSKPIR